jgi:hypothetical protein
VVRVVQDLLGNMRQMTSRRLIVPRLPKPVSPLLRLRRLASGAAPEFIKHGYRSLASASPVTLKSI